MDPKTGNREWRDLVAVLRCGIGNNFDINKLYFNRINILTDQDVDGFAISSGILAFFYRYMPDIIREGYLYKVYTPLYSLTDKDHPFVRNKREIIDIYHKKLSKVYKIKFNGSDKFASKAEIKEFLDDTYEYPENLKFHAKDIGRVNKFLVEAIVAYMVLGGVVTSTDKNEIDKIDLDQIFNDQKFIKYLMSRIQTKFKEIKVNPESRIIYGVIDGKRPSIKVTHRFLRKTSDLIPVFQKYGYEIVVEEKGKTPVTMTIGEFWDSASKYVSKIIDRFKGVGEINAEDLFKASLDINNRISVQYTMEDVEKELEIFNIVHGPLKKDVEKRKKMMKEYKIRRDDLDN